VRVTPYLHERRIYLRNRQPNKQYFMTSMDVPNKARRTYNDTMFKQINGHTGSRNNATKASNFDSELLIKRVKTTNKIESISVVIRMNITDKVIHVYAQNGSLVKRLNY